MSHHPSEGFPRQASDHTDPTTTDDRSRIRTVQVDSTGESKKGSKRSGMIGDRRSDCQEVPPSRRLGFVQDLHIIGMLVIRWIRGSQPTRSASDGLYHVHRFSRQFPVVSVESRTEGHWGEMGAEGLIAWLLDLRYYGNGIKYSVLRSTISKIVLRMLV
jgi:hypothetical protein